MWELLIKNGLIVDGTGRPAFVGSVAIDKGRIIQVSKMALEGHFREVIDADGLLVAPGFIDIHRHGDLAPFRKQKDGEEIRQGITTMINGNCGFSAVPSSEMYFELLKDYARPIMGDIPDFLKGMGTHRFFEAANKRPLHGNIGYLVGNGALRIAVKGFDASPMTRTELDQVCGLLRSSLEEGAFGLSLGLMYVPENFYSFQELAEICQIPGRMGRIVTAHIRGEGSGLLNSVSEIIKLARVCGGIFHISHLKAAGRRNWHTEIAAALDMIHKARNEGINVSFDVYPYCAGSTALYTLFPPKLMEGGMKELLKHLRDPVVRKRLENELKGEQKDWDNLVASTGWKAVTLVGGNAPDYVGRTVEDIAVERGCSPESCAMDLMLENQGDIPIVFHSMCQEDMERVLYDPDSIVISDALYSEGGVPHPRRYGSFARLISQYGNKLGLERAIQKITSAPAQRLGLFERGKIEEGMAADLVILDLQHFADTATYEKPVSYPEGIRIVVVNGKIACREGRPSDDFYGKLLRKGGMACRQMADMV
ncbi:MAG: amidohydrolase family protein [Eubacteriales bacterium]|nr:amidohydrolase family protein [Eubacteriales bacterium]